MTAVQGTDHAWQLTKGATPAPATRTFANTCDPSQPSSLGLTVTVNWTKGPADPSGTITVTTHVYATNPSARTITTSVTDKIYSGTTLLDTSPTVTVNMLANTANVLVLTHTFAAPSGTTNLNAIATATYIDPVTLEPVPGNTTATASASVTSGTELNPSALIKDVETLSGNPADCGVIENPPCVLKFSADTTSGASGRFDSYTMGTQTPGPVTWNSETQSASGSVTFHKTVYVFGPVQATGILSDVATLTGSDTATGTASASVNISADARVVLTITKTIDTKLASDQTFNFAVKDDTQAEIATASITIAAGQLSGSTVVSNLAPGSYTVSESSETGFYPPVDQPVTIDLPLCEGSVSFVNQVKLAQAYVKKVTDPTGSETLWQFTLTGPDSSTTTIGSTAAFQSFNVGLKPGHYTITESSKDGWTSDGGSGACSFDVSYPEDAEEVFYCTFTNTRDLGSFKVTKSTTNLDGATLPAAFTGTYDCGGTYTGVFSVGPSGSQTVSGIPTGNTCSVVETAPAPITGYTWGPITYSPATIVISTKGGTFEIVVGNSITRDRGSLTIVKKVVNDNGGTATVSAFGVNTTAGSLTFDSGVPNGTTTTYTSQKITVVTGAYTLKENDVYGYTEGTWSCTNGTANPTTYNDGSVYVGKDKDVVCTIINDDQPGTIIIKKITKPADPNTNFTFNVTGDGYNGFGLADQGTNSQTLNVGTYTVKELVPLGWVLTGIGGAPEPNPYNCTVIGSGSSTGVGDLNTQTATISLKNGDTVTCVFENTGQGATRTQGFWATHPQLARIAWFGGSGFGHDFPGVAAKDGIGDRLLCGRPLEGPGANPPGDISKVMGGFWSDISKTTEPKKRSPLDQARMQLLQQLLAAELNASAFGSVPSGGTAMFAQWESAYCGTNTGAISTAQSKAASFNSVGDSSTFTPGTSADSKNARAIANKTFWDILP